jgi:hypothetical protein
VGFKFLLDAWWLAASSLGHAKLSQVKDYAKALWNANGYADSAEMGQIGRLEIVIEDGREIRFCARLIFLSLRFSSLS